jgi:hypothetical protein
MISIFLDRWDTHMNRLPPDTDIRTLSPKERVEAIKWALADPEIVRRCNAEGLSDLRRALANPSNYDLLHHATATVINKIRALSAESGIWNQNAPIIRLARDQERPARPFLALIVLADLADWTVNIWQTVPEAGGTKPLLRMAYEASNGEMLRVDEFWPKGSSNGPFPSIRTYRIK